MEATHCRRQLRERGGRRRSSKTGLRHREHPTPYRLEWLKKGNKVTVSKCCLVNFSIGNKYKDRTWCDVVAMNACHLFLVRPWQYDWNVHHDGRKNTYSFLVDNVKLTLLPNPWDVPKPPKEVGQTLLAKQEFIREMLHADQVYLLYDKECNPTEIVSEVVMGFVRGIHWCFPKGPIGGATAPTWYSTPNWFCTWF